MFKNKKMIIMLIATLMVAVLLASCGGGEAETTAAPTVPGEAPPATAAPGETQVPAEAPAPSAEDVWSNIQANGKLVAGTSADYPPFEFVTAETFQLDGFDIAIMREIGRRLGVEVELRDMAFDGLPDALQLNQIDVAIAALSVTPERQAVIDFTNVYYVGADAIVAKTGTQVVINSVQDMAAYRIGVQTGSVYQAWLQDSLVVPGLIPAENLVTYENTGAMIRALVEEPSQVDLLVMDLLPAEEIAKTSPVMIAAQGLNQQLYSIAIPKGQDAFLQVLNDALINMQTDGTTVALAKQYLGLEADQLPPTPTPGAPVITPAPPVGCLLGMMWKQDLSIPDGTQMGPGESFTKGWRIENTGTCTWDSGYALVYVGSVPVQDVLSAAPTGISGTVQPSAKYDVNVNLVAPDKSGVYKGFYTMSAPDSTLFGDRIWVQIEVVGGGDVPTPSGAPVIENFTVIPAEIPVNSCADVNWAVTGEVTNIKLLGYEGGNETVLVDNADRVGTFKSCPTVTGEVLYKIVATGPGGTADQKTSIQVK
jgi:polar amino acid transport system substrate-binding protein